MLGPDHKSISDRFGCAIMLFLVGLFWVLLVLYIGMGYGN